MTITIPTTELHIAIVSMLIEVLVILLVVRHRQQRKVRIADTPWPTLATSVTDRSHSMSVTGAMARADQGEGARTENSARFAARGDL